MLLQLLLLHPHCRVPFGQYGKLKETLDLSKVIKREHYKILTVDEVASKLNGNNVFSILDEKDGF